jgi:hypothetical protein
MLQAEIAKLEALVTGHQTVNRHQELVRHIASAVHVTEVAARSGRASRERDVCGRAKGPRRPQRRNGRTDGAARSQGLAPSVGSHGDAEFERRDVWDRRPLWRASRPPRGIVLEGDLSTGLPG